MQKYLVLLFLVTFTVVAGTKDEYTADQIIDKSMNHKTFSYDNSESRIIMTLIEKKSGTQEKRTVKIRSKKNKNITKVISLFIGGKEINGVKFLAIEKKNGDDEQYIYYPAQNRINRIVSKNSKNQHFLGTDFTYYDIEGKYRKDGIFKRLKDKKVNKQECYVISAKSKKESPYSKTVMYIRKSDFLPIKVKFYNKDGKYFKKYSVKKTKIQDGKTIITKSQMVDKKRGHATILTLDYVDFNAKISDSEFNKENLR